MTWEEGEPVLGIAYSQKWDELFGSSRHPENPITRRDMDLAASIQAIFEETFFHLLKHLYEKTRMKKLCFAGGCAFNSLANGKIFDHSPFEEVYIQAAAGDAGTALGSALYVAHHKLNRPRDFVMDHAFWGPEFGEKEISEALNVKREALKEKNCVIEKIEDQKILCQRTARAISEGKVVGWFQGRMEWGPRALGNRSILADPRRAGMKDILNARIKHRESFRPFAPSILEEKADEWFEMKTKSSPFMNFVFSVRAGRKDQIPAVIHVDGTARVHTVTQAANPLFWNLIKEFEKISRVPILLNTSFNDNEPIVCAPGDALDCFIRTQMDILAAGPYWIERQTQL
jgi:carbamoyltransferase